MSVWCGVVGTQAAGNEFRTKIKCPKVYAVLIASLFVPKRNEQSSSPKTV